MLKYFILISILIHAAVVVWLLRQNVAIYGHGVPYYFEVLDAQSTVGAQDQGNLPQTRLKSKTTTHQPLQKTIEAQVGEEHKSQNNEVDAGLDKPQISAEEQIGKTIYVQKNKLITNAGNGQGVDWSEPQYPYLSRLNKEEGIVMVNVQCFKQQSCQIQIAHSSGYQRLDDAVMKSYVGFQPPIDLNAQLVYEFKLHKAKSK